MDIGACFKGVVAAVASAYWLDTMLPTVDGTQAAYAIWLETTEPEVVAALPKLVGKTVQVMGAIFLPRKGHDTFDLLMQVEAIHYDGLLET